MEIISKEEYEQKLNIARKKVENFEEIKKIEQQFEMGIITKEEKDEKINAILNAWQIWCLLYRIKIRLYNRGRMSSAGWKKWIKEM